MRIKTNILLLIFILGMTTGCSVKKFIPENELLYEGATIKINSKAASRIDKEVKYNLEDALYPEPNSKLLGGYPKLYFYYSAQKKNPSFITKFLNKKLGEKPVYLSDANLKITEDVFENRLENNGYFFSKIATTVNENERKKRASVDYEITVGEPYRIKEFELEKDSIRPVELADHIEESLEETEIELEDRFDLKKFKTERQRIEDYLKHQGYYYFSDNFLLFEADTNRYKDRGLNLFLKLKEDTPEKVRVPYVIDSVHVYANVVNDTVYGVQDTTLVDNVAIIQGRGRTVFNPKKLRPFLLLEPGQYYNPENSKFTSRRLTSIGNYKFVNIYYTETDTVTDEQGRRHLKSVITLSPLPRNTLEMKVQGVTKSNDFAGPGLGLSYTNRNIFRGGENFNADLDFGYEKQFSREKEGTQSIHLGFKTGVTFPRLLFPWNFDKAFRYAIPKTKIGLGVDYLDRSELYSLINWSSAFGYTWDQNRFVSHGLQLIKIDYVKLSHTSERFDNILNENPFLKKSFEQQFIAGINYSFSFNQLNEEERMGKIYFQFNMDVAGNGLNLFSKGDETKTFLGLKYAQYFKADVNISYHRNLDRFGEHVLVGRLFAGYGIPYGNSESLPFVKQYFSGGPYSLRAFNIRSLGPGTYKPTSRENAYFDQAGDIRLETNIEYRFPLFSYFRGGVFFDAGNVWLKNENEALPGGKFSSDFIKELGMGAGLGVRVDIQGFVLRFDLAAPVKRPREKWQFEYRRPVFNFGIGYPF